MVDNVHMMLAIPLKYSVAQEVGYIKGKNRPEQPPVIAAREWHKAAENNLRDAQRVIAALIATIAGKENRRNEDLLLIRNLETRNIEDPSREARGWYPHIIQTAMVRKCVKYGEVSPESATSVADLEKQTKTAEEGIASLKQQLPGIEATQANAKRAYDVAVRETTKDTTALAWRFERSQSVKRLFNQATQTASTLEVQRKTNAEIEKAIEQKKKEEANIRRDFDDRLKLFSKHFADIIQEVMGAIVEASIAITAAGFAPHVSPDLLAKPDVAQKQIDAERPAPSSGTSSNSPFASPTIPSPSVSSGANPQGKSTSEQTNESPKCFYGTVNVDAQRINRDVGILAAEIIHHLAKLPNAQVKVTVEIQADAPGGIPDDVVRTVNENCRSLKFNSQGFEKE